jgi:hypothetical protein
VYGVEVILLVPIDASFRLEEASVALVEVYGFCVYKSLLAKTERR